MPTKLSDEIVLYLYKVSRTSAMQYVSYNQLYAHIKNARGSTSENEFTSALRYLVGKRYVQEEAAHYRLMSEGEEHAQNLISPPTDYNQKAYHEQQRGNEIQVRSFIVAIVGLLLTCLSIVAGFLIANYQTRNTPPNVVPTSPPPTQIPVPIQQPTLFNIPQDSAPVLLGISERITDTTDGLSIDKIIYFSDSEGDAYVVSYIVKYQSIARIDVEDDEIEASPEAQRRGTEVIANWDCGYNHLKYSLILEARIFDRAGNQSDAFELEFQCE